MVEEKLHSSTRAELSQFAGSWVHYFWKRILIFGVPHNFPDCEVFSKNFYLDFKALFFPGLNANVLKLLLWWLINAELLENCL